MTLSNLDHHINMYIHKLQLNKSIKGVNNIRHEINHSKRSKSIYLSLSLLCGNYNYKRTVRFSDHRLDNKTTNSNKFKGMIVTTKGNISHSKLRDIEACVTGQIKKLLRDAPMHAIYTFTAR